MIDSRVDTRGLDFRFADEDDDVRIWSGEGEIPSGLAGRHAFVLADSMQTFRVQNDRWGVGFELRARGTGSMVGTEIQIGIMRALDLEPGEPMRYGVEVESGERSFGDWIEVEYARLFRLEGAAGGTAAAGGSS